MRENIYDSKQVERDYQYYKDRDQSSDSSIYFMLKERYKNRMEIAEAKFLNALKEEEGTKK